MARTKKLIKYFTFEEGKRSQITLGTGTRLNPETPRGGLQLAEPYSTAPDLTVRTWVTNPKSVKQWLSFEVDVVHGTIGGAKPGGEPTLIEQTSLGFRLGDGTDEYWWDGGAWVVNTTSWNTEAEVAGNIATFPVTERKLQIILNLVTSDPSFTPTVYAVKVLYASDAEFLEDVLYRSLVPALRDYVRPIADYGIDPASGSPVSTLDLQNDFPLKTPYNVVDIDAVYDHSADPDHLTDLFAGGSYNPTTKVVTLGTPVPAGNLIWLRFVYEPEVAITTGQDFHEIARIPALALDDVNFVDTSVLTIDDQVVNRETLAATVVKAPTQGDLEIVMHVLTDKGVDQKRLQDEVNRFFANHPTVRSAALDEEYSLWLIDEYDMRTPPGSADFHTGQLRFRIRDVVLYVRDSVDRTGVSRFRITGTEEFVLTDAT